MVLESDMNIKDGEISDINEKYAIINWRENHPGHKLAEYLGELCYGGRKMELIRYVCGYLAEEISK